MARPRVAYHDIAKTSILLLMLSVQEHLIHGFGVYRMSMMSSASNEVGEKQVVGSKNKLKHAHQLRTSFIALRHGESLANQQGIISSHPDISTVEHGLSEEGKRQAQAAGEQLLERLESLKESYPDKFLGAAVISSDYLRAKETADMVALCIQDASIPLFQDRVLVDERLRERGFGELHGTSDKNYQKVWSLDAKDPNHTEWNCESINSVLSRTTSLVVELEEDLLRDPASKSSFWACILVAHGDVLQILQTAFANINVKQHRSLLHLKTGVPRDLILTTDQDQVG